MVFLDSLEAKKRFTCFSQHRVRHVSYFILVAHDYTCHPVSALSDHAYHDSMQLVWLASITS